MNKKRKYKRTAGILFLSFCAILQTVNAHGAHPHTLPLAGPWSFRLDPDAVGLKEKWYSEKLPDTAKLPGSLDEQGLGHLNMEKLPNRLTREYQYVGPAWYQKVVTIPADWGDKQITLFLERCHWETRVWVDDNYVGMQNSLSVPQVHDLTGWLKPGKRHVLTMRVDNTVKISIGHAYGNVQWAHAITEETQTNWNGIVGRIELIAKPWIHVASIQIHPDFEKKTVKVEVAIENAAGQPAEGTLDITDLTDNTAVKDVPFSAGAGTTLVEVEVPFAAEPTLWGEFSPVLHTLEVVLSATAGQKRYSHRDRAVFGLRDFVASGHHFKLNGRTLFLRGNLDCCIFPLTGYPPMETAGWKDYLGIIKSHGMNHVRFHSWCPPEAAFRAADELGMIFQIEPPLWDGHGLVGQDIKKAKFILEEADRIVDAYGNHPSFCLMSMGNELGDGTDPYLAYLLDYLQKKDSRILYTSTTHPPNLDRKDDYFVGANTEKGGTRGDWPFNDFRESLEGYDRPLIAHEVGQPCMYPDYTRLGKYTGPLKPRNLELFKASLEQKGMLDQAADFHAASGALLVELYKENIEAQLRTPTMAGFQLLGLQDFPGQGTALIGVLDAFCDSKGLVTPEAFRRFCSPTVPLARMEKFVWTTDETFAATAEVAHYGPDDLENQPAVWTIATDDGEKVASGKLGIHDIPTGKTTGLGKIGLKLSGVGAPTKFILGVALPGAKAVNSWKFWVYPEEVETAMPDGLFVSSAWDGKTRDKLKAGGKVLLFPPRGALVHVVESRWYPVFWSKQLFWQQPETMGILCDPDHPVFADFATDFHCDWQWREVLERSEALVLDGVRTGIRPLIQFVPDFNTNRKMSALMEARVGSGRLLVCTLDLQSDLETRPVARQLLHSLLRYAGSDAFAPGHSLQWDELDELLKMNSTFGMDASPQDLDKAVLNVKAAATAPLNQAGDWSAELDNAITRKEGIDYEVKGGVWRDAQGAAWVGNRLVVDIACPAGFEGRLYAHFHDWNSANRAVAMYFTGRDMGPLFRYDGEGVWVEFPVSKETSANGRLTLEARTTGGPNAMITQIALVPEE